MAGQTDAQIKKEWSSSSRTHYFHVSRMQFLSFLFRFFIFFWQGSRHDEVRVELTATSLVATKDKQATTIMQNV